MLAFWAAALLALAPFDSLTRPAYIDNKTWYGYGFTDWRTSCTTRTVACTLWHCSSIAIGTTARASRLSPPACGSSRALYTACTGFNFALQTPIYTRCAPAATPHPS